MPNLDDIDFIPETLEPTQQKYRLKCTVLVKDKRSVDHLGKQFSTKLVFLLPEMTDQGMAFLTAWLPEVSDEKFEIIGIVQAGFFVSPARLMIRRPHPDCPEANNLMVMSDEVRETLLRYDGKRIGVTILPESAEFGSPSHA